MVGFREVTELDKQTITFSMIVKDNVVTEIGRSYIRHPKVQFNGNGTKWYEDKQKDNN